MKKILFTLIVILIGATCFAVDDEILTKELNYQKQISDVGINILNSNKIDKKIIFTYNDDEYKKSISDPTITRRQIVFYEEYFKYISNEDELAAFLAHEVSRAVKSYSGIWGGFVSATQVKASPKKYELFADKRAVDYMVHAGYNPLGLITFINKSTANGYFNIFHNTPTRRMSVVYEYIYYNYPAYLEENAYLQNKNYQNFLLNTRYNRAMLKEKIKTGSHKEIKYE